MQRGIETGEIDAADQDRVLSFIRAFNIGLTDGHYVYFAHGFACDDGPATAAKATTMELIAKPRPSWARG